MRTRTTTVAVLLTALALGAGCAAHKDDGAPVAAPRTIKPVQGCGKASWTDPADLAPGRTPARCDKGAPAPRPSPGAARSRSPPAPSTPSTWPRCGWPSPG